MHANTNIVALMTTSYLRDELYDELFFCMPESVESHCNV